MNTEQLRAEFEAWWESTSVLKENKRTIAEKAYQAGRAALQLQPRQPEISRHLLGKIVDEVFDGAIEDASVIEDIYRVIAREAALQSQDREDAERLNWLESLGSADVVKALDGTFEVYAPDDDRVYATGGTLRDAIDHARRVEEREGTELDEKVRYAGSLAEVECSRCGLKVISSCKAPHGECPVPDAYARRIEGEAKP